VVWRTLAETSALEATTAAGGTGSTGGFRSPAASPRMIGGGFSSVTASPRMPLPTTRMASQPMLSALALCTGATASQQPGEALSTRASAPLVTNASTTLGLSAQGSAPKPVVATVGGQSSPSAVGKSLLSNAGGSGLSWLASHPSEDKQLPMSDAAVAGDAGGRLPAAGAAGAGDAATAGAAGGRVPGAVEGIQGRAAAAAAAGTDTETMPCASALDHSPVVFTVDDEALAQLHKGGVALLEGDLSRALVHFARAHVFGFLPSLLVSVEAAVIALVAWSCGYSYWVHKSRGALPKNQTRNLTLCHFATFSPTGIPYRTYVST
jgi:hypothetical protein